MKKWLFGGLGGLLIFPCVGCHGSNTSHTAEVNLKPSPYVGAYNVGLMSINDGSQLVGKAVVNDSGQISGTVGKRQGVGVDIEPGTSRNLTGFVSPTGELKVSLQKDEFDGQLEVRPLKDGFGATILPADIPGVTYVLVLVTST